MWFVELLKGRDEVIRSAVVDHVANGKHNRIKHSINMLYAVETSITDTDTQHILSPRRRNAAVVGEIKGSLLPCKWPTAGVV